MDWLSGGSTVTGDPAKTGVPRPTGDERAQGQDVFGLGERERDAMLAWVGENITLVRRSVSGQRDLYWSLGIGFGVGLAAHVGGFLLKSSATTEPVSLMADLLYALGWALWTSAIVVLFVQVHPEAKKRQYKQALDAYEAAVRRQSQAGGDPIPNAERDWEAALAETAASIRELDPLADDYDDKLAALRATLREQQGGPATAASTEAVDAGAS